MGPDGGHNKIGCNGSVNRITALFQNGCAGLSGQRVVSGDHPTGAHQEWAVGAEMMTHFFFSDIFSGT
jgi:hypothetical protein